MRVPSIVALALFAATPIVALRATAGAQAKPAAAHQYVVSVSGMT